jgi:uncharacterized lipoprotein YmbA
MIDKEKATQGKQSTEKKQRVMDVSVSENGIVVFKFQKLSRTAIEQFTVYVHKFNGQYPDPLRMIYDFRGAGLPGLAFLQRHTDLIKDLQIPERTRWAYIVDRQVHKQFMRSLVNRLPDFGDGYETFTEESEAVEWLMRSFDEGS